LGESGIKLDEGTRVWPFDLKKSKKDCRISVLVMVATQGRAAEYAKFAANARGSLAGQFKLDTGGGY
jgi:hypothetical protein